MKSLARAIVGGDENRADDLFQEAMLAALEKPPSPEIPFRAWITGVMKKLHLFGARTDSRRVRRESIAAQYSLAGSSFPPDIVVQQESERKRVIDAVLSLDDPERSAILFRFYDKLTIAQIAERTEVAEKTVQRRINRSLHKLSRQLDKEHGGDGRSWKLAIAPIAGLSLSQVAAAESAFIAASLAAKGAGVALWIKGAAALALLFGVSLTVLHFVQTDRLDNNDPSLLAGDDRLSPDDPHSQEKSPADRPDSGDPEGLAEMEKQIRVPLRSEQIPFSMHVVDLLDPDQPVTSYHIVLRRLYSPDDPLEFVIDEEVNDRDGYFSRPLPASGRYNLKVWSPVYRKPEETNLYLSSLGLTDFKVTLDPGLEVSGWIIDEEGLGIEGAVVTPSYLASALFTQKTRGPMWGWTETDSEGYFKLGGLALSSQQISLIAVHDDYGREDFQTTPMDENLRVTLERGFRVSGVVKDDYGIGTGKVDMQLIEYGTSRLIRPVHVDESGSYETPVVHPGRFKIKVTPLKTNNSFSADTRYVHVVDSDVENFDFGMTNQHCTLTGQLFLTNGLCTTGAVLFLRPQDKALAQPSFKSACDQEGHYEFKKLLPGSYDVWVEFPSSQSMDGVATIELELPGDHERNISITGGSVSGRINNTLPEGSVASGFIELHQSENSRSAPITISLDSAREFCFVHVPQGEYSIECRLSISGNSGPTERLKYFVKDESGQPRKITVIDGESQEIVIDTPRMGQLRLVGEGFDLKDMQFFNVKILNDQGDYEKDLEARCWSDGNWNACYRFEPGERIAKISFRNIGYIDHKFSIVENQTEELTIKRDQLVAYEWLKNIHGSVLLANGEPAAGRTLHFFCTEPDGDEERYSRSTATLVDSQGQYSLDGAYPGKWSVSVRQKNKGNYFYSSISYLDGIEIKESDPTYQNIEFIVPTGGIRARLIDGETLLPIDSPDAYWRAEIFNESRIVTEASRNFYPGFEVRGIPAGTNRLFLKVRGYDLKEEDVFIFEGQIEDLGDIVLQLE